MITKKIYKGKAIFEQLQDDKQYLDLAEFILDHFEDVTFDGKNLYIPYLLNGINLNLSWNELKVYIDFGKIVPGVFNTSKKSWRYFQMDIVKAILIQFESLETTLNKFCG